MNASVRKELNRKISISIVSGKAADWFEELVSKKEIPLVRFLGFVTDYKADSGDFGEYIKFKGQLRGINLRSGEIYDAPVALFPAHVADALKSAIDSGRAAGNAATQITVAMDVHVKYDAKAVSKYTYSVSMIDMPSAATNPLDALTSALGDLVPTPLQLSNAGKTDLLAVEPAPDKSVTAKKK
jgi:hypothetical protein